MKQSSSFFLRIVLWYLDTSFLKIKSHPQENLKNIIKLEFDKIVRATQNFIKIQNDHILWRIFEKSAKKIEIKSQDRKIHRFW